MAHDEAIRVLPARGLQPVPLRRLPAVKGAVRIPGLGREIPASPAVSVLNLLLREGVGIQTRCGGRARCGRCLIRIVAGAGNLSPRGEAENRRLDALKAEADMRLACQTYTRGDLTIEIVHPGAPG